MTLKRRDFLLFLGAGTGTIALDAASHQTPLRVSMPFSSSLTSTESDSAIAATNSPSLNFKPIQGPMPLETDGIVKAKQATTYQSYEILDDLVLPEGFTYDVIAAWGDKVGNSRFGSNNDYLSFVETGKDEGLLTVNHEYISAKPWVQGYQKVMGKSLPFAEVMKEIAATGDKKSIDAFALPDSSPLKAQIKSISKAAQLDQGMSIISIRRNPDGKWERTFSQLDRRISGISGLEDGLYLKATGPAVAIFKKQGKKGYEDNLGDRIIGTHQNCAGGSSPWGTVFSAEENFQGEVAEPVYGDGSAFPPGHTPFLWETAEGEIADIAGQGNVLGYAGNKYGWMVEVDPANPNDYGTKHSWLGRFRHEAVGIRAVPEKSLVFYSGCDRRGGHLYKFVSKGTVRNPKDKANSRLLEDGMLYAAKFNPDGTGSWIALKSDTPTNPDLPSVHAGKMIPLPKRPDGGYEQVTDDTAIAAFKQKFKTLDDLYEGNVTEKQGAILIDAHYAANAVGATCTARPEDTDIAKDGSLFIAFTSGSSSKTDGSPDLRIFKGKDGKAYEYGWIMRLVETGNEPGAMTFNWKMFATGGEPSEGGAGFANPDNIAFDPNGNLWIVTDMSSDKHNKDIPSGRMDKEGKPMSQSNLRSLYGNNSIWFMPTSGANAGEAYLFGYGPMDCEATGPFFTKDRQTLFLAIQHPGEMHGIRKDMESKVREIAMRTTDGKEFMQSRTVPMGSNWPSKQPNDPPRSAVVAIRRINKGIF
jgi:uncharacterized protein